MAHRLEVTLKTELRDAQGEGVCQKARRYFGLGTDSPAFGKPANDPSVGHIIFHTHGCRGRVLG